MNPQVAAVFNKLAGKRVVLEGQFGYQDGDRASWETLVKLHQGKVVDALHANTDFLVVPELGKGKTAQKKAASLNARGAAIQTLDLQAFQAVVGPAAESVVALLRAGSEGVAELRKWLELDARTCGHSTYTFTAQGIVNTTTHVAPVIQGETFRGVVLAGLDMTRLRIEKCEFVGCDIGKTQFASISESEFREVKAEGAVFERVSNCTFAGVSLSGAKLIQLSHVDCTRANLDGAELFEDFFFALQPSRATYAGLVFRSASLRAAKFGVVQIDAPDFDDADLTDAAMSGLKIVNGRFRRAKLVGASLVGGSLVKADFTGADLRNASLAGADLKGARFGGANLEGCNLRGAKWEDADFAGAINFSPASTQAPVAGPAVVALDATIAKAKRVHITVRVGDANAQTQPQDDTLSIDSGAFKYGMGVNLPGGFARVSHRVRKAVTTKDALVHMATHLAGRKIRYETLNLSSTRSPVTGKALRDMVIAAIAEVMEQPSPPEDELDAATKAYRDARNAVNAEERAKQRDEAKAQKAKAEAAGRKEKKKLEKRIEKEVGKVADVATFLKALELRIDAAKIAKATKMLKAEGFKLFNDVTDAHLNGVVKSQSDPDLVYACRIESDGKYSCCTQHLNVCGGLRGSICKHLLVLIIGLVQAGELDPATIDGWVAKSRDARPELNKETMGEIFIRYKGAEAGEVDWRPTQTVPEDYYAL